MYAVLFHGYTSEWRCYDLEKQLKQLNLSNVSETILFQILYPLYLPIWLDDDKMVSHHRYFIEFCLISTIYNVKKMELEILKIVDIRLVEILHWCDNSIMAWIQDYLDHRRKYQHITLSYFFLIYVSLSSSIHQCHTHNIPNQFLFYLLYENEYFSFVYIYIGIYIQV